MGNDHVLDWHYMYREVLPALLKEWIEFEIFCRLHFIKRGESFYYKTKYTYGVLCKLNADLGMRGGVHSRAEGNHYTTKQSIHY